MREEAAPSEERAECVRPQRTRRIIAEYTGQIHQHEGRARIFESFRMEAEGPEVVGDRIATPQCEAV